MKDNYIEGKKTNLFREITIPGDVLDDENLSDGAKIMYGKIARLSLKNGFCNASNYFLDGTKSGRNASRFIAELKNAGFILIENDKSKFRKIRICPINSKVYIANSGEVEKISTSPNLAELNYIANSGEVENNPTSPNLAELNPLHRQIRRGETVYIANSGEQTEEKEVEETSSSGFPKPDNASPPVFTQDELKNALFSVDKTLFLDNFYPQAAAFMSKHNLDLNYLDFIHSETSGTNYKSFKSMYYTLFFKDSKADEYKIKSKPVETQPPPPDDIKCPVCGTGHSKNDEKCPECSLPGNPTAQMISLFLQLVKFPVDRRNEYLKRESLIYSEFKGDFHKLKIMIAALENEFHIKTYYEEPSRSYHP